MSDDKNRLDSLRNLIKDPALTYPVLYSARGDLEDAGLSNALDNVCRDALNLTAKLSVRKPLNIRSLPAVTKQRTYSALKWMVDTGSSARGYGRQYDEIMDLALVHVIRSFGDKEALGPAVDLLFERSRREAYTHDLVWACYESKDPGVLLLFTQRLLSEDAADVELAKRLLSFLPLEAGGSEGTIREYYDRLVDWIYGNYPFLYYTGESYQESCKPKPFEISYDARYLCRRVNAETGEITGPLSEYEASLLQTFGKLDAAARETLSAYSLRLYTRRCAFRNAWLGMPAYKQLLYVSKCSGKADCRGDGR